MKSSQSLGFRLTALVTVVLITVTTLLLLLVGYINSSQKKHSIDDHSMCAKFSARYIGMDLGESVNGDLKEADIVPKLDEYKTALEDTDRLVLGIFVLDSSNSLVASSSGSVFGDLLPSNFEIVSGKTEVIDEIVIAVADVRFGKNKVGSIVMVESGEEGMKSTVFSMFLIVGGMCLAIILMVLGTFYISRRTAAPLIEIAKTTRKIADGDLGDISEQVQTEHKGGVAETRELADAVAVMARALRKQVIATKTLTIESAKVSNEVAQAMAHLASSAAQQAAAVAETASTVEEMEKAGKSAAQNARQIVEAADKSTEASIRGLQAVDTTSEIIMQIKEDSQEISSKAKTLLANVEEIGNIIRSVNAIAEQSKILAVNASIEAAKAGEYGSGFAVVAQEVKDLAQQSKNATQQITQTLTAIRKAIEEMVTMAGAGEKRTEQGVKMVANAGAIVNDLSEAIRENSEFANIINTAVNQQTLGLTQIATAIEEINASATENQDISRNIEKGTHRMTDSLEELAELVGVWKTSNQ